jgi:hypothetical protein
MKFYFRLQGKRLSRQITELGVNPLIGYILITLGFAAASTYLFIKIQYAEYVYALLGMVCVQSLSKKERTDFLKTCFPDSYQKLRMVESIIVALPFALVLVWEGYFLIAVLLLLASAASAITSYTTNLQLSIPTPFGRRPFEFLTGFRRMWWLFGCCYLLTGISLAVGNMPLGVFSLVAAFLSCLSFYGETEPVYYIWIYSLNPKQFLLQKIKTALLHSSLLCLPIAIALLFHRDSTHIVAGVLVLGYLYMINMVVAKYSAFPQKIGLLQGILSAVAMAVPPLLLAVIPYFYFKSINRLNVILA